MASWGAHEDAEGATIAGDALAIAQAPDAHRSAATELDGIRRRDRPAPGWLVAALIGVILVIPAWMLADDLRSFALIGDDFAYVSEARDWPTTRAHLLEPHNTHVVPIFRLWTFVLVMLAGRLEFLPVVLAAASYLALVAAMLAIGYLLARETRQALASLAVMAVLGLSTVSYPAVTWYSASQALWAGVAIVATVALARAWAAKGGIVRFAALALGAIASPAIWSGGLAAGPAAIAYLYAKRPPRFRGAALSLAVITAGAALMILAGSRRHFQATRNVWGRHPGLWPRPIQALLHTAQALIEVCGFGNLGVDATTTPWQAVALLLALAALHAWSRGGLRRINPLEAAGAAIAIGSGLIAYTFRGNLPYSSLRPLGWYYAIPQVGAVLFVAGWWTALRADRPGPMTLGQAAGLLGLVIVYGAIQAPRGRQQLVENAPPFAPNEATAFPTTELRVARAIYYKDELHRRQFRALARLDRIDRILSRVGASPETLRDFMGRVLIPGIPDEQSSTDAFTMLAPRPRDPNALDALSRYRSEITDLLRPEPEPVPFWLDPEHPVSRSVREVQKGMPENPRPR